MEVFMEILNNRQNEYQKHQENLNLSKYKVFFVFGIAIGVTTLVTFLYTFILDYSFNIAGEYTLEPILASIIVPGIVSIITSLFFSLGSGLREGKVPLKITMFSLYSISMGIMLSAIQYLLALSGVNEQIFTISLLITSSVFVLCGILGFVIKNANFLISVISFSSTGLFALIIANIFLGSSLISWIVSLIFFLYMISITIYDFKFIQQATANVDKVSTSLAIICAFRIYSDFIVLLFRVLLLVMVLFNRK